MTTLDFQAIEAAVKWLDERWVDTPIPPWAGEAYRDMLAYLRPGELRPAVCMLPAEERPSPEMIMDMVLELRNTFYPEPDVHEEPVEKPAPKKPRDHATPDHVYSVIDQARKAVGK